MRKPIEGAREALPERGDRPGPGEVALMMCEHGHIAIGPNSSFTIDENVDTPICQRGRGTPTAWGTSCCTSSSRWG